MLSYKLGGNSRHTLGDQLIARVNDLISAAVIECDVEYTLVYCRIMFKLFHTLAKLGREGLLASEEDHADLFFCKIRKRFVHKLGKKLHNGVDLGFGTFPVFGREGVDGYMLNAKLSAVSDYVTENVRALTVTVFTRH